MFFSSGNFLGCFVLEGTPAAQKEFGVQGGAALIMWMELCTLVPSWITFDSVSPKFLFIA